MPLKVFINNLRKHGVLNNSKNEKIVPLDTSGVLL